MVRGMSHFRRGPMIGSLLALLAVAPLVAQSIRVTSLTREDRVLVSFELTEVYNDDLKAAIQSGLPTSITYDVELRRATTLWVDRLVDTARVTASVRFDNLTRRYQISVMRDGRVEDSRVTEDEQAVQQALTAFSRLPLFRTASLEPNAEYYVRVRAQTRPRNSLFVLPWERGGVLGSAKFTFLPR
jgi:Domain of unknown function (DUF4390)